MITIVHVMYNNTCKRYRVGSEEIVIGYFILNPINGTLLVCLHGYCVFSRLWIILVTASKGYFYVYS